MGVDFDFGLWLSGFVDSQQYTFYSHFTYLFIVDKLRNLSNGWKANVATHNSK